MTLEVDVEVCVDVDGDADGDVELVWQRDPVCFSADRLATSKPCGDVKSLDSAGTKCASKRAAQRLAPVVPSAWK